MGARLYVVSILAWEMLCGAFLAVARFKKGRAWLSLSQLVELRFLKSFGFFKILLLWSLFAWCPPLLLSVFGFPEIAGGRFAC